MKVGDKIKVVKDNHTNEQYIGLIGYVVSILEGCTMNICVSFEKEDNKENLSLLNMIVGKILHFDTDELNVIDK